MPAQIRWHGVAKLPRINLEYFSIFYFFHCWIGGKKHSMLICDTIWVDDPGNKSRQELLWTWNRMWHRESMMIWRKWKHNNRVKEYDETHDVVGLFVCQLEIFEIIIHCCLVGIFVLFFPEPFSIYHPELRCLLDQNYILRLNSPSIPLKNFVNIGLIFYSWNSIGSNQQQYRHVHKQAWSHFIFIVEISRCWINLEGFSIY